MEENQVHIPEGWVNVRFKDFIYFQEGPGLMSYLFKEIGFPFLNIRCIENGKINKETCQYISPEVANGIYKHFQLEENDLVVSTSGTLGKKAFITKKDLPLLLNTSIIRFKPLDEQKISLAFLNQLLEDYNFLYDLYSQSTGSAQVNVGPTHLKKLKIKIPSSVIEQTQIASILSKVDEAITQTQHLIAKYTRIKTGLMQDLLTKGIDEHGNIRSEDTHEFKDSPLGRIPNEWECENFGEYIELVHGYQFRNYDFTETGTPIVKIGQVKEDGLDLSHCSFINPNRTPLFTKQTINNGDVLMALTGATLGKACMVSDLNNPVMQNYRVGRFEPIFENDVDKIFLFFTLKSTLFLAQIFNNVNEAAQGNVGKSDFKKSYFIKPPFEEQLKIVKRIEKAFVLVDDFNLELNKYQSLKTGLMQDLLSGKVRVNHLIKETVSV